MKITFVYWIVVVFFTLGCALQTDVSNIEERMALLEQRNIELAKENRLLKGTVVQTHEKQKNKNQKTKDTYASLHANVDSLNDEIRVINGRIDETTYLVKQEIRRIENNKSKESGSLALAQEELKLINTRLIRIEKYLNIKDDPSIKKKMSAKTASKKSASDLTLYNAGQQAFEVTNFELARLEFNKLLKLYPKSKYADDAQFWIGEMFFQEKWYEKAIIEFEKVIEAYKKGDRVTAALLKQGLAFKELGDLSSARIILKELIKKYPKSNDAKVARKKLEEIEP